MKSELSLWIIHVKFQRKIKRSKLSQTKNKWRDEKKKKEQKQHDELKFSKHKSLHVFD
jgi:hypothetical protein